MAAANQTYVELDRKRQTWWADRAYFKTLFSETHVLPCYGYLPCLTANTKNFPSLEGSPKPLSLPLPHHDLVLNHYPSTTSNVLATNPKNVDVLATIVLNHHPSATSNVLAINLKDVNVLATNLKNVDVLATIVLNHHPSATSNVLVIKLKDADVPATNLLSCSCYYLALSNHYPSTTSNVSATNPEDADAFATNADTDVSATPEDADVSATNPKDTDVPATNPEDSDILPTNLDSDVPATNSEDADVSATNSEDADVSATNSEDSNVSATNSEDTDVPATNPEDSDILPTNLDSNVPATNSEDADVSATNSEDADVSATNSEDSNVSATNSEDADVSATNSEDADVSATNSEDADVPATNSEDADVSATNADTDVSATNLDSDAFATNADTDVSATNSEDADVSATNSEDADVPATNSEDADVSATNSEDSDVLATNPDSDISATNPEDADISATNPEDADVSATNPDSHVPATNPDSHVPATNPDSHVSATNPDADVSATNPDSDVSATNPKDADVPATNLLSCSCYFSALSDRDSSTTSSVFSTNPEDAELLATNPEDADIPATNPEDITQLWSEVMDQAVHRNVRSLKDADKESSTSKGTASPYDSNFDKVILPAYGMNINEEIAPESLLEVYNQITILELIDSDDKELDKQQQILKTKALYLVDLDCWQQKHDTEIITDQFRAMSDRQSNETAFLDYAKLGIFCIERIPNPIPADERLVPARLAEDVCIPGGNWKIPPLQGSTPKPYSWDIRPDCSYGFSLQAFGPMSKIVERHVVVHDKTTVCTYLSTEFKKSSNYTEKTAKNQLIIASSISLYNRFLLKNKARKSIPWSVDDYKQLRHYGFTFLGPEWTLYCTIPNTPLGNKLWCTKTNSTPEPCEANSTPEPCEELPALSWTGCEMLKIASGNCRFVRDTRLLLSYLFSVHFWGLYTHAESCREDIQELENQELENRELSSFGPNLDVFKMVQERAREAMQKLRLE